MYDDYKNFGFSVLGFFNNEKKFGSREPGDMTDVSLQYRTSFAVEFPMFADIRVSGPGANPL